MILSASSSFAAVTVAIVIYPHRKSTVSASRIRKGPAGVAENEAQRKPFCTKCTAAFMARIARTINGTNTFHMPVPPVTPVRWIGTAKNRDVI